MRFRFVVEGDPVGWQRAGQNYETKTHFTQKKTADQKKKVALAYKVKARGFTFQKKTPLALIVVA